MIDEALARELSKNRTVNHDLLEMVIRLRDTLMMTSDTKNPGVREVISQSRSLIVNAKHLELNDSNEISISQKDELRGYAKRLLKHTLPFFEDHHKAYDFHNNAVDEILRITGVKNG